MDELTQDIGIELHTEAIMHRAEQLARLESDKIVDKVSGNNYQQAINILATNYTKCDLSGATWWASAWLRRKR